jgi:cytochrome b6-f complex iron-sulfur subunit
MAWAALTAIPFVYGIIKYIYPPFKSEKYLSTIVAAQVNDIPINTAKIVRFNKRPVIVIHTSQEQFKAFSANCTHLGCVVEYRGEDRLLHCNCHGSVFDLNGKNLQGPATTPLEPLKVSRNNTNIIISAPAI